MKYFDETEFQGEFHLVDERLLEILDEFREAWGHPVSISPAKGAVARTYGTGFHNYLKHGSVKAIDIMPSNFKTKADFQRAVDILTDLGCLGIGLYPDWRPYAGLHIDIGKRSNRGVGNPATWSARRIDGKQHYFGIEEVL